MVFYFKFFVIVLPKLKKYSMITCGHFGCCIVFLFVRYVLIWYYFFPYHDFRVFAIGLSIMKSKLLRTNLLVPGWKGYLFVLIQLRLPASL